MILCCSVLHIMKSKVKGRYYVIVGLALIASAMYFAFFHKNEGEQIETQTNNRTSVKEVVRLEQEPASEIETEFVYELQPEVSFPVE